MFRLGSRKTSAAPAPAFAFCEPVTAVAMGKWHLRRVGEEGLKHGGGLRGQALCGRDITAGWDLQTPVTPESALSAVTPRVGDGHVWLCPRCHEAYAAAPA